MALLVTAPPCVWSVAVIVHDAPVVIMTLLNANGEEAYVPESVPPLSVHDEVMLMTSPEVPPLTSNVGRAEPAVPPVGAVENVNVAVAAAGNTPTRATPPSNSAVPSPTPMSDFALDDMERRPALRLFTFMGRLLEYSIGRDNATNPYMNANEALSQFADNLFNIALRMPYSHDSRRNATAIFNCVVGSL